ncbi:hypothetical protein GYMLUDRAFT_36793 [Collybiopsis luxurians FD-317 M1]|nr:hypothetical protein GYMLUDRAFT_36793 [Collybiopsis luxurians FD-317 M1]
MSLARRKIDEEVVEDSEPEREAQRLVSNSVIDISDDDSPLRNVSVIEISDSSCELPAEPLPQSQKPTGRYFIDLGDYDSDSELDMTLPQLRLAKYAHVNTNIPGPSKPKSAPSLATRIMSTSARTIPVVKPLPLKKPAAVTLAQRLNDDFGDTLSRLLGCVSCDLTWTTRKSTTQKVTHMRSCAKKHGITDDTLVVLVRKAIDNVPTIQSKGKGKAKDVEDGAPKTFFDDVMLDAAPKKRGKRPEVVATVKQVEETRDDIMSKARAIVAKGDAHTRAIREHKLGQYGDFLSDLSPSSTPRFGKSALAKRPGIQSRSMFHNDGRESPELSPSISSPKSVSIHDSRAISQPLSSPPTQTMLPDGNETVYMLTDAGAHSLKTPSKTKQPTVEKSCSPTHPIYIYSSSSPISPATSKVSKAPSSPPLTPSPQKPVSSTSLNHPTSSPDEEDFYPSDNEMGQLDEAYLHYEPALTLSKHLPKSLKLSPREYKSSDRSSRKPKSRSSSPAAPRRKGMAIEKPAFNEEWTNELKKKILQDRMLHLRILRFEPLPLHIFLPMAETSANGSSSAKLKLHLRDFLDKQGINFYDAEGPKGRRRH